MAHTLRNQNAKLDLDMNSNPARSHSASPEPPPLKKGKSEVMEIKTGLLDQGFDPYKMPCRDVHKIYERIDSIDQGVYGNQGKNRKTKEIVALKKVKIKSGHRNGFPITSIRETNILMLLKHPNIVDVKEVVYDKIDGGIFLVMEYMEHDLKRVMTTFMKNPFTVSEVKCLFHQLLSGIAFMHANWVVHRDLKTSNLLYDNQGRLKICDFGMARTCGSPAGALTPNVITLWYRAPEMLLGAKTYGPPVDMWAAGAVLAELLLKKGLFEGTGELDQIEKIFKVLGTPNYSMWPGLRELPGAALVEKMVYRPSLRAALNVNGRLAVSEMGLTLLRGLLCYNPSRRLTAEKALQHPWFKELPSPQSCEMMPTFPSRSEVKKRDRQRRGVSHLKAPNVLAAA